MEIYQEPIIYQHSALRMKVWRFIDPFRAASSHIPMPWHYHKEIEFILVEHGIHEMETPERSYTLGPGDIVVLGSSQLHRPRKLSDDPLSFIVLHVDLEPYFDPAIMMYYGHFAEVQEPLDELNYIFADKQVRSEVGRIITSIHDEVMSPRKGYEIAVSMHIQHLMLTLLRQDIIGKLQSYGEIDAAVIRPVVAYVEEHLTDRIDMQEVCRIAGMSYTYFSKYFKRKMGVSFTDFVNRRRISYAKRLLVTEQRKIQDIAESVGIGNMAHFYELFKRYNQCTPKQYMEKMLEN